jgi:hypothetical protein
VSDRYPGYDVLAKRDSPSWNEQTRRVIDARVGLDPQGHHFFVDDEWLTVRAICERIIPLDGSDHPRAAVAAMLDERLHLSGSEGYRDARLPPMREAWRRALAAFDSEARAQHGCPFHQLDPESQTTLLKGAQEGKVRSPAWGDMSPPLFFSHRLLHDIVTSYYAHPSAWNDIGFGGPAAPRGYVRMTFDRRDPWEAAEAHPGKEEQARNDNLRLR